MPALKSPTNLIVCFCVAAVCTTAGVFIGRATIDVPRETTVLPAFSVKDVSNEMLMSACVRNDAFVSFSTSEDHRLRRQVDQLSVEAAPLSDRGVVCHLTGIVDEASAHTASQTVVTRTHFDKMLITSAYGKGEFVSREFAMQLLKSEGINAIASNEGIEGQAIPKLKVVF